MSEVRPALLTGKRFKLEKATLGVERIDGKRRAVTISAGEVIKVLSGPSDDDGMVDVLWDGRSLEMFAVDVDFRGTEIVDQSAKA